MYKRIPIFFLVKLIPMFETKKTKKKKKKQKKERKKERKKRTLLVFSIPIICHDLINLCNLASPWVQASFKFVFIARKNYQSLTNLNLKYFTLKERVKLILGLF